MKKSIKKARKVVQNLIRRKKKAYFANKLTENTKNPKKLWKILKQLGLSYKSSPFTNICLEAENGLIFDPYSTQYLKCLKDYFLILQMI